VTLFISSSSTQLYSFHMIYNIASMMMHYSIINVSPHTEE